MHVGPATWNLHTQGMATLLQLRGTAGFDSVVGRNLFWLLFNSVVSLSSSTCVHSMLAESFLTFMDSKFDAWSRVNHVHQNPSTGYESSRSISKARTCPHFRCPFMAAMPLRCARRYETLSTTRVQTRHLWPSKYYGKLKRWMRIPPMTP